MTFLPFSRRNGTHLLVLLFLGASHCSFERAQIKTIKIKGPSIETYSGPALTSMGCFFVTITAGDITNPSLANLPDGCTTLKLGVNSKLVSLTDIRTGIEITGIPKGEAGLKSRTISIYGAVSTSCSSTGTIDATTLFASTADVPDIYLLASTTVDLSEDEDVAIPSTYQAGSADSLTVNCKNNSCGYDCTSASQCGTPCPICIGFCANCNAIGDETTCTSEETGGNQKCVWSNGSCTNL